MTNWRTTSAQQHRHIQPLLTSAEKLKYDMLVIRRGPGRPPEIDLENPILEAFNEFPYHSLCSLSWVLTRSLSAVGDHLIRVGFVVKHLRFSTGTTSSILDRFGAIWFLSFWYNQGKVGRANLLTRSETFESDQWSGRFDSVHSIGRRISQLGRPTSKMYWTGRRICGLRQC
jgi:hypothetical protein